MAQHMMFSQRSLILNNPVGSQQLSQAENVGIAHVWCLALGGKMPPVLLLLQNLEGQETPPRAARVHPALMQSPVLLYGGGGVSPEQQAHPHTDRFSFLPVHASGPSEAERRSPSSSSWALERMRRAQLVVPEQPMEIPRNTAWGFPPKAQAGHW